MAPLIASLIGSGLNLLAGAVAAKGKELVEEKLGVSLDDALLTEDGRASLRQVEIDREEFLISAATEADKLAYADTASARDMNTRVNESANASWLSKNIAALLALLVTVGGGIIFATASEADVRTGVIGVITLVLGFYFGSSRSSQAKDTTIEMLTRSQK